MKKFYLLFLCLSCLFANAQLQRNYTSYTVDNGLAQNSVWDAFQDYKGFIWLGTADGITRLDGNTKKQYRPRINDSTSFAGNTTIHFFEDKKKQLWIGHNRGLSIYNRKLDCFKNIPILNHSELTSESQTRLLGEDKNGNIWCFEMGSSLYVITPNGEIKQKIVIRTENNKPASIGNAFFSMDYIFGHLNDSQQTIFRYDISTGKTVFKIYHHKDLISYNRINDSLYCHYERGSLFFYNVLQNSFTKRELKRSKISFPVNCSFTVITKWHGKFWMGNNYGLFVFDSSFNSITERIVSFNQKEVEGFHYLQNLKFDNSGNLWICTNGAGVYTLSPYRNKFTHYTTAQSKYSLVRSIAVDKVGNIYSGLYSEGIICYKKEGASYGVDLPKRANKFNHVCAIYMDGDNLLFSMDGSLFFLNIASKVKRKISYPFSFVGLEKDFLYAPILKKVKSQLYFSNDKQIFKVLPNYKLQSILPNNLFKNYITSFEIINDSIWWIGTNKELFSVNINSGIANQLNGKYFVKTIYYQSNFNRIWVGCNSGLYLFDINGRRIKQFETNEGLPDDFIYGILEDKSGLLWLSHNKGLSVYDSKKNVFKHFSVKDGLQSNEFNTGAYYKDEKGLLYFGGVNGINVINPSAIIENRNAPQIAINEILLDDLPYKTDTAYNEIKALSLSYIENTLSFDFSALDFSQPENNTYQYKLSGYDNNWIQSGTKHFARYANLPPGYYIFQVKAANGDGYWNETPRELAITIWPPFWQTTWFYSLLVILFLGLLALAFFLLFNFQKRKLERAYEIQRKLEEERLRISRDLHDNVGAQLSYLITNVEWMLQHPDQLSEAEEKQRLSALSEAGRNAILTLRQTIWAISHTSLSVDDFSDRFKQFVLKMLEFNKEIQVTFTEDFTKPRSLSPSVALNLFRVCQEAFNNALRHAQANEVKINFSCNEISSFRFSIKDNGIGFNWKEGEKKGHYGLLNMKARAEEMGAVIEISSEKGSGTEIKLSLI